jgi:hypothetical protein
MGGVIGQHQEPKEGAGPIQYSELNVSGFKEQLWVCLRRNFTIYNRAPGKWVGWQLVGMTRGSRQAGAKRGVHAWVGYSAIAGARCLSIWL